MSLPADQSGPAIDVDRLAAVLCKLNVAQASPAKPETLLRQMRPDVREHFRAQARWVLAELGCDEEAVDAKPEVTPAAGELPDCLFVTFKVTGDGERGHSMDHILTRVAVDDGGLPMPADLDVVMGRIVREVQRRALLGREAS